MRRLYTLLLYLALPGAALLVLLRGLRNREYWRGWRQRFGAAPARAGGGVWVHAVSVGEVQAAVILINALRARQPQVEITLTCATPTGRLRAQAQLPGVAVGYAPYDLPACVRRFLRRVRPRLLVIIETELWPNLLHATWQAGVPTLLASARVSQRTARFYQRWPGLLRPALAANAWVAAQSTADAQRFTDLGALAGRVQSAGNLKFDRSVPPALLAAGQRLRQHYAATRALWVAGSTHAGEESQVLQAHRRVLQVQPTCLLVLAPRHPPRFAAAAAAIAAAGLSSARRSEEGGASDDAPQVQVLLLDTLGELMEFYAAADLAFVGGSLIPIGGHNLLEPAAVGIPVLTGPYYGNSPQIAQVLSEQGALTVVRGADSLAVEVLRLLADSAAREAQGSAARAAIEAHRGALTRILDLMERLQVESN